MGRWATNRRRGGGGQPTSAPAAPINITGVTAVGTNTYRIALDAPVNYDGSGSLDNFSVDTEGATACLNAAGSTTSLDVTFGVADGPGLPWALSASPPQTPEIWANPQSGTTT